MKFTPSPGIAVIELLKETENTAIVTSNKSSGRIIKGKVIAMGADDMTQSGTPIVGKTYARVGNTVWFLHYYDEGGVDVGDIDGKKYYFVKWGDIRGHI